MTISLKGAIRAAVGTPISGAVVQLFGSRDDVGALERASVENPTGIIWEPRSLGDFTGSRWNCWQRFVMNQVAGITWEEFKDEVVQRNPALEADDYAFKPGKMYHLPRSSVPAKMAWTRTLSGFAGSRWDCWTKYVQGRVAGLTWEEFKGAVVAHNPALADDGYVFRQDKAYRLPEMIVKAPSITWTRLLSGFSGNRWACWEQKVKGQVEAITWAEFKEQVVAQNPHLAGDGYLFSAQKVYLLPENGPQPRYYVTTRSDSDGHYSLAGLEPGHYLLVVDATEYHRYAEPMTLESDIEHEVTMLDEKAGMTSHREGYATAPLPIRKLIDQALSMLGDDHTVYDALPPELQKLAWGHYYVHDPNHFHYKDIVCADLVTICLAVAGVDYSGWKVEDPTGIGYTTTHAANYFRPSTENLHLLEPAEDAPWLPGDIIIYGQKDLAEDRVHHVDIYVGPCSGVDRSGNFYPLEKGYAVVNASIDYLSGGTEVGTAIRPFTLEYCRTNKFGFRWWKRVRSTELERIYKGQ